MAARSFTIRKQHRDNLWASVVIVAVFLVVCVAIALGLFEIGEAHAGLIRLILAGTSLLMAAALVFTIRSLRGIPREAISVDAEGIWKTHRRRDEGLVPWDRIRVIETRWFSNHTDLQDDSGRRLLSIHNELYERGLLDEIIAERAPRLHAVDRTGSHEPLPESPLAVPTVYWSRPQRYMGFAVRLMVLSAATFAAWAMGAPILAAAIFAVGGAWSAVRNRLVVRLAVKPDHLTITQLYGRTRLRRSDIDAIKVQEIFDGLFVPSPVSLIEHVGYSGTAVVVVPHGGERPYQLYAMGVGPEDLARRLQAWRKDDGGTA